jgi:signal transduction histidine kinase/ligand-binding sensor domain-containing protein
MPSKLIQFLFISFAYCLSNYSIAQTIIPRFESLGVNDGLSHSSVYAIYQDRKGFMWFGTANGLCSYDGTVLKSFKYSVEKKGGAVNNFIRGKLSEDKKGNIWYTNESGIYKWDIITEIVNRELAFDKGEFGDSEFRALYMDDQSVLWMLNIFHGLFEYNTKTKKLDRYPIPIKIDYSRVLNSWDNSDADGNTWLHINTGRKDPYIKFEKTSHQFSLQFTEDPPQAIFFDKNKSILAYNDRLVWNDDAGRTTLTVPTINGNTGSLASSAGILDNYGRLWMTESGGGLCYYDRQLNRFYRFKHDNFRLKSLPFDLTTCLFIDRDDNLWIGSDGGGVARIDLKQPRFNLFPLSEGDHLILSNYFSKCFYEDEKRRIWFGTHNNGLNIYDPVTDELTNFRHDALKPGSLPGNITGSILKDRENNIWIGSSGGISIFNEERQSFQTIDIAGLPPLRPNLSNFVFKMIQLQNGDILAATVIGIIKITKEKGQYRGLYFKKNRYLISFSTDITEMPDSSIYITLPGIGLYQLKPHNGDYRLVQLFFKSIDLRSIRPDERNKDCVWIGSGIGLIHFNTVTHDYKIWNEKDGMANSYVYGSLEETGGNLWISTNRGLSYFNRQKNRFDNYSYLDGLQSNEFNTQAFYKSKTGTFYFGGIKGFNWFRPGEAGKQAVKPVAAITGFEINDSVFQKDSGYISNRSVTVPYHQNDFNFHFAALNYTRPEANRFQYMLRGWDKGWIVSENKSARYANLPPGEYLLKLKVSNADGVWSEEERISLTIKAPFWKQGWFVAFIGLLFLLIVIFITRRLSLLKARRKLQLLEKQIAVEAERNRISADMHDEIGSGITHIALLSELIHTQQKGEAAIKKDVQIIATSARRLVQTMSEIIWALNPQNDTLENLLAYIRERSSQHFESFNIQLVISFPDEVPFIRLTNENRRNLYLVTKELLNNAMKHSGATRIDLSMEINGQACCFIVKDDGTGMSQTGPKSEGNGIRNLKKRMKDIGGTISWLSPGKGTSVNYCLPV